MFWTWLLLVLYAGLGLANIARGLLAFAVDQVLRETSIPFWLLGLIYLVWGLVLLGCGLFAFHREDRGRWIARGSAIGYQVTVWVIRLVGDVATHARRLWIRDLILSLLFVLVVFLLTGPWRRASSR